MELPGHATMSFFQPLIGWSWGLQTATGSATAFARLGASLVLGPGLNGIYSPPPPVVSFSQAVVPCRVPTHGKIVIFYDLYHQVCSATCIAILRRSCS